MNLSHKFYCTLNFLNVEKLPEITSQTKWKREVQNIDIVKIEVKKKG